TFDISIDQLSFGTPDLSLVVGPAGLGIQIQIPQLVIEVTAKESVFGWTVKGGFTADLVTIQAAATFGVLASGGMDFQIPAAQATFQNFHLRLPSWISWLSFIAEPLMQNFLSSEIQKMLANQGAAAVRKIVDDQATLNLLGAPATFSYAMKTIGTDAQGIFFD